VIPDERPSVAQIHQSPSLASDFRRDGAVCVRGAFSPEEVALVERGIERNLAEPSAGAIVASRPDDAGRFVEDFCNWQVIPEYEQFIRGSAAAAIAGELLGSERVRLFHDHLLVKEPGTSQRTPWHQDQPYYNVEGKQVVSMWMPVDPVALESTLEFVAGSHLGPWLMPRTFLDEEAKWFPEGSLEELPDIDADPEAFRILGWALERGDAVFFHMLTLHAWRRRVGNAAAPGVLGALPRRRRYPCTEAVEDVPGVPGPGGRATGRSADGAPALPGALGARLLARFPTPCVKPFDQVAEVLLAHADVIYSTIRLIERDDETFLPWARDRYACIIFDLHTEHTPEALERTAEAFRGLIDAASSRGGSYFLTYHRWATKEQLLRCYPQFPEFLAKKREYDPEERFQSDWYRHYRELLA
jgi:Phytanoyl-CoA dioxygenase (PhyH)